jgi:hypothetical protein
MHSAWTKSTEGRLRLAQVKSPTKRLLEKFGTYNMII